jgi:hypothetical protein
MLSDAKAIYLQTRKKHDQLFNTYFMRPIAAGVVAIVARTGVTPNQLTLANLFLFVIAAALFVALPDYRGGLIAVLVLEVSYCLDCADGMLARHKKIASKEGHLFDFFTDELKATLLVAVIGIRLYRTGGLGLDAASWSVSDPRFLFGSIGGTFVIASAISLTNFLRRPELSGQETTVDAFYENVKEKKPTSVVGIVATQVKTFLRFLNHYPSHIWLVVALGRLDVFFWVYIAINLAYLGQGWLGVILRFGRPARPTGEK